jgi:peptidyl-prolyl cis-trans isomerase-like protein 2
VAVLAETEKDETPRADVFDLLNIVPYIRKFKTSGYRLDSRLTIETDRVDPVTGKPLETSQLIKLNFFKVGQLAVP